VDIDKNVVSFETFDYHKKYVIMEKKTYDSSMKSFDHRMSIETTQRQDKQQIQVQQYKKFYF